MNRRHGDSQPVHIPRSRALGMHLVLVLVACVLGSRVLLAHQASVDAMAATSESATPWGGDYFPQYPADRSGRSAGAFFR